MKTQLLTLSLWSLILLACGGKPSTDAPEDTGSALQDADNDGFSVDVDCDDSDASVNPDADELCDGIDNNCDGETDGTDAVDQTTTYEDSDGDTYGDPTTGQEACEHASDRVSNDLDCDDYDSFVNPAANELCDGIDNDCDATTTEDGLVNLFLGGAGVDNITPLFVGTDASTPVQYFLDQEGDLRFCPGTYYVNLEVAANASVTGYGENPGDVVLDGADNGPTVKMLTNGVAFSMDNLTLQNGSGELQVLFSEEIMGGGLLCHTLDASGSTLGTATVELANVVISNNTATLGGGVAVVGCDLDLSDTVVSDNVAFQAGGGLLVFSENDFVATEVQIESNEGGSGSGGFLFWAVNQESLVSNVIFDEVVVADNTADSAAGVVVYGANMQWTGTNASNSGLQGNIAASDGALSINSGDLDMTAVDFGEEGSANGNAPFDLAFNGLGSEYNLGDNVTASCLIDGFCGTTTDHVVSTASFDMDEGTGYVFGNAFLATADGTIETIELLITKPAAVSVGPGSCTIRPYLLSSDQEPEAGSPWEILHRGSSVDITSAATHSVHLGTLIESGKYYVLANQLTCTNGVEARIEANDDDVPAGVGLGDIHSVVWGNSSSLSSSGTVNLDLYAPPGGASYSMTVSVSDL